MKRFRHYLQFNDLVFDEYDMVVSDNSSVSFKENSSEKSFGHGSYIGKSVYVNEGSVSMTLTFRLKKIPCEDRDFYRRFIIENLTKYGKLWAVQDNTLIWAWAKISNLDESGVVGRMEMDVSFTLPEGIWHKADMLRTFLVPYSMCDLLDCLGYKKVDDCDCCGCIETDDCCCCDDVTKDMALCFHKDEVKKFYDCDNPWMIKVDCAKADKFFGNYGGIHFGQKICGDSGIISGVLYSDTEFDTVATIRIHGKMIDPMVMINGNKNIIQGEFLDKGELDIYPNGTIAWNTGGSCSEELDISAWKIPEGNDFGFTIHPGNNRVVIYTNICETACAYIEVDALTI